MVILCHLSAPAWPQLCPNVPAMPGMGTSLPAVLGGAPPGPSPDPKPQPLLAHPKTCSNAAWHRGTHPNPWGGSGSRPCTLTCIHTCTYKQVSCPYSAEWPWSVGTGSLPASLHGSSHALTCTHRRALALVCAHMHMLTCMHVHALHAHTHMHTPTHPHTCVCVLRCTQMPPRMHTRAHTTC